MQIYSRGDVPGVLGGLDLAEYLSSSRRDLQIAPYTVPEDTGSKTQMASYLSEVFLALDSSSALIAITGWSAWPSQSNFDLFNRYRQSFGETRNLIDSPCHLFKALDKAAFASILGLCLYFLWDAEVVGLKMGLQVSLGHHGTLDLYTQQEQTRNRVGAALFEFGCNREVESRSES
jgi:hypothetical protein